MVVRPVVPWFSDDLKKRKAKRRKCERKMLRSGCSNDKELYYKVRDEYSALLRKGKITYYSDLINQCSDNSKKLFRIISSLSKQDTSKNLPPYEDPFILANQFGTFFGRKIELINDEIDKIDVDPIIVEHNVPEVLFECFFALSENDIRRVILESSNVSCQLDPIPTYLLKACCDVLCPIITKMVNMSFEQGKVPENWKLALIRPLLKKLGMDSLFENFRPVNNLPFVAKITERIAASQLLNHCNENAPLPVSQSAYRQFHSTETALLKVHNDILINMDNEKVTLLVMLDMSAAFDTIDHGILIDILMNDFGVTDRALQWFRSYLANRKQHVVIDRCKSSTFMVTTGVPQGSCLGPLLFLLYVSGLTEIVSKHLPFHHVFADDTQLYLSFKPQNALSQELAVKAMEDCINELCNWMTVHRLFIQSSKTEFIIIGSRQQLSKVSIDKLGVGEVAISPVNVVRNLGFWFDRYMSMNTHVSKICGKAFRSLYNIKQIRKYLTEDTAKILVHAFVTSHIDYCNSLLYGIPRYQLDRLQKVLNAAARVVCLVPKFDHITPTLMKLHWLPVKYRVIFKILLLVYKALNGLAPKYISDMVMYRQSNIYSMRSDDKLLLHVPITRRKSFGDRAFMKAGPTLWNILPYEIRLSSSLDTFKTHLKTFLYRDAYINNSSCF